MNAQNKEIMKFNKHIESLFSKCAFAAPWDFTDKGSGVWATQAYVLNRLQKVFRYNGLPATIPKRDLELLEQVKGFAGILKANGEFYAMHGGLGGELSAYYMPTIFTVANPALNYSKNLKIDEECIIIPNDSLYMGVMPLINKYATLLTEAELTFRIAIINSRIISLVTGSEGTEIEGANKYFKDIEDGKLGAIGANSFTETLKAQPYGSSGNSNNVQSSIEAMQYARATLFNELGLSANYNMKREALNSAESAINNDILLPLIDDMLEQRQTGWEKVKQLFGLEVSVELDSSWEDNQEEIDKETEEEPEEPEEE